MADAWGGAFGHSWGVSWGSGQGQGGGGGSHGPGPKKYKSRKRWILPDGTHVFGTAEQVQEIAEELFQSKVVVLESKPEKPVVVRMDDGEVEALAIYPGRKALSSASEDKVVAFSQTAEISWILAEHVLQMLEDRKLRRRKIATLLLLS